MGKSRREGVAEVGVTECGMLVPAVWFQMCDSPWFVDDTVLDEVPRWGKLYARLPGQPIDATMSRHYKELELQMCKTYYHYMVPSLGEVLRQAVVQRKVRSKCGHLQRLPSRNENGVGKTE